MCARQDPGAGPRKVTGLYHNFEAATVLAIALWRRFL